jgi:peptidoglycan hydrolase-like protein with peptidoglycan-binding domain
VAWSPDAPDPENPAPIDAEQLRNVQRKLAELGYPEVGRADGAWGTRTRAAVLAFRADNGLPTIAQIDDEFLKALAVGKPRMVNPIRAKATVEDLRAAGSETIAVTDTGKTVGAVVTTGGIVGMVVEVLNGVLAETESLAGLKQVIQPLAERVGVDSSLLLLVIGAYLFWENRRIQEIRLRDHQSGKHLGR